MQAPYGRRRALRPSGRAPPGSVPAGCHARGDRVFAVGRDYVEGAIGCSGRSGRDRRLDHVHLAPGRLRIATWDNDSSSERYLSACDYGAKDGLRTVAESAVDGVQCEVHAASGPGRAPATLGSLG